MNRLLRRLGACGVLAIGVLIACAGFYGSALAPLQAALALQKSALERQHARTQYQPLATSGRAEELARFYELFPTAQGLTDEVQHLHRLAHGAGLDLAQGEYRLERHAAGLWAYRAVLPVRGTYPALRDFTAAVLKDMPVASIEALRFERKGTTEAELEAQLRITLYVRPAGEAP